MKGYLTDVTRITRVSNAVADGTSAVNSSAVSGDDFGTSSLTFLILAGSVTAACSAKLQSSNDGSTWSDVSGTDTTIAATDDNKVIELSVAQPLHDYYRCVVTRTGSMAVDGILALVHRTRGTPNNSGIVSTMV